MYSTSYTAKQIAHVQSQQGLTLRPSSIEKVRYFTKHLDSLIDPESGLPRRHLLPDEIEWIDNEKILSALDFKYWASRYAKIRSFNDQVKVFDPWISQQVALNLMGELEEQRRPLNIQYLKARQLGVSSLTDLQIGHRVLFYANVNAVIASADDERSKRMAGYIWFCYDNLPWWMMPAYTVNNVKERTFGGHNSSISIQNGQQVTGVARGSAVSIGHLSEIPFWGDPDFSIDASFLKAVHDGPQTMIILESTANGMGDWWDRKWRYNTKHWPHSRFRPLFLPWFVGSDIYPTEDDYRSRFDPKWEPEALTLKHAEQCAEYVERHDYLRRYLGNDWQLPPRQQWYWEITRQESRENKTLGKFYQEMPATDLQAFQAGGASPFEPELIEEIEAEITPPWGVFGLLGTGINDRDLKACPWTFRDVDTSHQPIAITCQWLPNLPRYQWTLLPLKFGGWDNFSWQGKIIIWEPPQAGSNYAFGVDTSYGLDRDSSVIEGMRIGDHFSLSEQVVEFANPQISADDLWPYCMALGSWYSGAMSTPSRTVQPKIVVECNANGENTQNDIKKRGWRHFHDWRHYDQRKIAYHSNGKIGWFTISWSRHMLMSSFVKGLREKWIKVNSPRFIGEMKSLSKDDNEQAMKAEVGTHDDLIMALGMVYFSSFVLDLQGLENPNYRKEEEVYATYSNPQALPPLLEPWEEDYGYL